VQAGVAQQIAATRLAGQPTAALEAAAIGLQAVAGNLVALGRAAEAALAPLQAKLAEVETWYDTVMQGFSERYSRHMKTAALLISFVTVLLLNANFFTLYRTIATDAGLMNRLVSEGQVLVPPTPTAPTTPTTPTTPVSPAVPPATRGAAARDGGAPATPATATTAPTATTATTVPTATTAASAALPAPGSAIPAGVSPAADASPAGAASTAGTPPGTTVQQVRQEAEEVAAFAATFNSLGFSPLSWSDVASYWHQAPWGAQPVPPVPAAIWWRQGASTALGWLITTLLLSAGAPFWEDLLESLFGIKTLLQQKTATRNVEEDEGGQPKP
jgi:hypothetical protein